MVVHHLIRTQARCAGMIPATEPGQKAIKRRRGNGPDADGPDRTRSWATPHGVRKVAPKPGLEPLDTQEHITTTTGPGVGPDPEIIVRSTSGCCGSGVPSKSVNSPPCNAAVARVRLLTSAAQVRCNNSIGSILAVMHDRKLNVAGMLRRVIDALLGLLVVARLGLENIGHKSLRVAVVEREPA